MVRDNLYFFIVFFEKSYSFCGFILLIFVSVDKRLTRKGLPALADLLLLGKN